MTNPSTKHTRLKYGDHKLAANQLMPNPFDNLPIEDAIRTIGETRLAELTAKAKERNWSEKRIEAEIRCLADEVASHANDREDD